MKAVWNHVDDELFKNGEVVEGLKKDKKWPDAYIKEVEGVGVLRIPIDYFLPYISRSAVRHFEQTITNYNGGKNTTDATVVNIICGQYYLSDTHIGRLYNTEVKWLNKQDGTIRVTYYKIIDDVTNPGKEVEHKYSSEVNIQDFKQLKHTKELKLTKKGSIYAR